ncbi:MAG: hypothetical protein ACTSX6_00415 [Candidatus Heimdallarchaeaceae archaeon]
MQEVVYPERMGAQKAFILAIGAFLGVVVTNYLIHVVRQSQLKR